MLFPRNNCLANQLGAQQLSGSADPEDINTNRGEVDHAEAVAVGRHGDAPGWDKAAGVATDETRLQVSFPHSKKFDKDLPTDKLSKSKHRP